MESREGYHFTLDSSYSLSLDRFTGAYELSSQYLPDWRGRESYAVLNRHRYEIKIYDLATGLLADSIRYQGEGPEGVGRIYGFHIHNRDSIFLNALYNYRISLVNSKATIVNTYSLLPEGTEFSSGGIPKGGRTALPIILSTHPAILIDHFLYVSSMPDGNPMEPEYYDSEELMIRLNLKSVDYEFIMGFTDKYKGNIWGVSFDLLYTAYNKERGSFVLGFTIEDNVYETRDFKSFEKHLFHSSFIPEVRPMSRSTMNVPSGKLFRETPAYANMLYDAHRKLYFRMGYLRITGEYQETRDPLANPQDFVVIVADDAFNVLHEEVFKQPVHGQYVPRLSFVNESGLHIAFIDYENEDKLAFVNFTLQKNE